jgi:tripartite-type tricarboxylate transporter receptor subunit TctC
MTISKALTIAILSALATPMLLYEPSVRAADYPTKPVRLVVGQPPGGPTDVAARVYADKLRASLGQPIIVENKPGAASQISIGYIAHSEPDGYTLLYAGTGLVVLPYMSKTYDIDSQRDITPISIIVTLPAGIAVSSSINVHNLDEFMADIKANPGKRFYGNMGAIDYLIMQKLKQVADLPFDTVRFNGAAPGFQAMFSGDVQFTYTTVGSLKPYVDQGKMRIIVVAGNKRSALAPDVPAIGESKDPMLRDLVNNGFSPAWFGLVGPAKLAPETVEKLYTASANITHDPDFVKRMSDYALDPIGSTPDEFAKRIKDELATWQRITKQMNFQPE